MTINIFVEQHPNEDIRTIHLGRPVTLRPFSKYSGKVPKKVTKLNNAFGMRPEIGGTIGSDYVSHKEIRIERNKAFSWDEAVDAAIIVLQKFYKCEINVTLGERNPAWDAPRIERDDYY